jgi:putative hemolysin
MQDLIGDRLSASSLSATATPAADNTGRVGADRLSNPPSERIGHRHIVDELLEERAVTLRRVPLLWSFITRWCLPFFKYRQAIDWSDRLAARDGHDALRELADYLDLDVRASGLEHVPKSGRLLIVANHPSGMVDALAIRASIGSVRHDLFYFSNRDAVRLVPKMSEFVIPVEWLQRRRTRSAMRETLDAARVAFRHDGAIVIFPAGGMARGSLFGLQEMDWLTATLKLMRRYGCPVLPVHIRARNSLLYYAFELVHTELRDLLRFREILGKRRRRFVVTIGAPIASEAISGDLNAATAALREYVVRGLPRGALWRAGS